MSGRQWPAPTEVAAHAWEWVTTSKLHMAAAVLALVVLLAGRLWVAVLIDRAWWRLRMPRRWRRPSRRGHWR